MQIAVCYLPCGKNGDREGAALYTKRTGVHIANEQFIKRNKILILLCYTIPNCVHSSGSDQVQRRPNIN